MMRAIDLNADVGEGAGNDHELLAYVSSASIACGAHAGNDESIRLTMARALELGVAVGAHPGHADREYYGRRRLPVTPEQVGDLIGAQLDRLWAIADEMGGVISYLKAHGALYHQLCEDPELARAAIAAVKQRGLGMAVLGAGDSCLDVAAADAGVPFYAEAFADRAYSSDGALAPRNSAGALFEDEAEVVRQAMGLAVEGAVATHDGKRLKVRCDSICLHGDTRWAVEFAAGVRLALARRGVPVRSFG